MEGWVIVNDETKEPKEECLAVGYNGEMLMGWVTNRSGEWFCESDDAIIEEVEAFITKTDLNELRKQSNKRELYSE